MKFLVSGIEIEIFLDENPNRLRLQLDELFDMRIEHRFVRETTLAERISPQINVRAGAGRINSQVKRGSGLDRLNKKQEYWGDPKDHFCLIKYHSAKFQGLLEFTQQAATHRQTSAALQNDDVLAFEHGLEFFHAVQVHDGATADA